MNVNDFEAPLEFPENMLKDIFHHQHSLMAKYLDIEERNGLLHTRDVPVNIHSHRGQARVKDMCWRCIEEVAEAMEAYYDNDIIHFHEELGDALHFLTETCLLSDVHPYNMQSLEQMFEVFSADASVNMDEAVSQFTVYLGLACNCLKNKPWKQSQMMTDEIKFKFKMLTAFLSYIRLCSTAGFNPQSLYSMYMRKNQVNQFRQRSGY